MPPVSKMRGLDPLHSPLYRSGLEWSFAVSWSETCAGHAYCTVLVRIDLLWACRNRLCCASVHRKDVPERYSGGVRESCAKVLVQCRIAQLLAVSIYSPKRESSIAGWFAGELASMIQHIVTKYGNVEAGNRVISLLCPSSLHVRIGIHVPKFNYFYNYTGYVTKLYPPYDH